MKLAFTTVVFLFFSSLLSAAEMPIHGNWCGPGHPPELENKVNSKRVLPITVDAIDAACKIHDFAYIGRKPWGNSEADGNLAEAMTLILNKGTLWKYNPKPTLGDSNIENFKKLDNSKITEGEFLTAAAILAYMEKQQYINLFSDVLNGKISSILKIGTSSVVIATAPIAITNKLLSKLSKERTRNNLSIFICC